LPRPHPVVAALKQAPERLGVSKGCVARALRIFHALACEAERRGYTVEGVPDKGSAIRVVVRGHGYKLTILEGKSRVPHVPSSQELAGAARYSWTRIPDYDYVLSGKLELRLPPYYLDGRRHRWSDGKRWRLEDKLAQVLAETKERAELDEQRRLEAERRAEERRRAHQEALERALERLIQANRARTLAGQVEAWRLAGEVRTFCAAVRAQLPRTSGDQDAEDVGVWLAWAEGYADQIDPVLNPTGPPADPEPTPEALRPFLDGLEPLLGRSTMEVVVMTQRDPHQVAQPMAERRTRQRRARCLHSLGEGKSPSCWRVRWPSSTRVAACWHIRVVTSGLAWPSRLAMAPTGTCWARSQMAWAWRRSPMRTPP
jgi:hypothetical protein